MTTHSILVLPGDSIGPEVMPEVERMIGHFNPAAGGTITTETARVGDAAMLSDNRQNKA